MFTFESFIDLPFIWGGLIALAIFMYVLLDGFDLGIGILFPFAKTSHDKDLMMSSIAPFWDGNETWLVLGGGGLFAAFPLAYSILMPAFYIPITLMLISLVFRGVAFEFRFKATPQKQHIWDKAFHIGSLLAVFFQGTMLGAFVEGVDIEGREFSGTSFDWLSPFSTLTGVALIFGYVLLGSTWLIMKTEGTLQSWARNISFHTFTIVVIFMAIVSLWVPFLDTHIHHRWFDWPNILYLSPVPLMVGICTLAFIHAMRKKAEILPFVYAISMFSLGYLGLAISIWPFIVPHNINIWTAAAAGPSLSLMLVGAVLILPVILFYTGYCYYVFRGKIKEKHTY